MSDDEDERNRVWAITNNIIDLAARNHSVLWGTKPIFSTFNDEQLTLNGRKMIKSERIYVCTDENLTISDFCIAEYDAEYDEYFDGDNVARSMKFQSKTWHCELRVTEAAETNDARSLIIRERPTTMSQASQQTLQMFQFQRSQSAYRRFNEVFVDIQGDVSDLEAAILPIALSG
ncbi:MAG: hypothetical protein CMK09_11560 [Ponticaulis sp.]|mgnify:CR=1 FL=1|nr:hypothetical protein [Ponticaulis sp.]|tara:strand:+ start:403 stop:927 length:525 start_codon:yes stop_codon:yes gene_type:complete